MIPIHAVITGIVLLIALLVDQVIGDPRSRFHPVAMIGTFIGWWGDPIQYPRKVQRIIGVVMWFVTTGIFTLPFFLVQVYAPVWLYIIAAPFFLNCCFAIRSLQEHAEAVQNAVTVQAAQKQAALLVSRDTSTLSDEQTLSAAYESVAENLNDSIIAPLFYFALFGLAGAALYRAANTMDAMLGYKDERARIGWFAARADDLLSFIPARLTGFLLFIIFLFQGRFHQAYAVFQRDRKKRPGYNGGIPISIMAGGVGVLFEKKGVYRIGIPERSLALAGCEIISLMKKTTILFVFLAITVLLLFSRFSNM